MERVPSPCAERGVDEGLAKEKVEGRKAAVRDILEVPTDCKLEIFVELRVSVWKAEAMMMMMMNSYTYEGRGHEDTRS